MPVSPNEATVVSVLRACADLGALTAGRKVHCVAMQLGIASKPNIITALIVMYSKCGRIDLAERLFERITDKDLFSTTAMIAGLASHGRSQDALKLFGRIGELGFKPDEKTITAVLSACRNSGLVAEGYKIYNNMRKFGLKPKIQHYGCMVDLLARAGQLKEAEGFIRRMPVKPDSLLWRNLIWASRFHKDMDRAKRLIEETKHLKLDSGNGDSYILKGNVYASDKNWEERARVRDLMMKQNVRKMPGCSRIEMKGVFHEFEAGDRKHPEREQIYRKWEEIAERLKIEGHKPKFSEVLLDVEDEEKALQLNHHSEKLAVAFGLMNTSPGEDILIVKNLRACKDCHDAMKLISRIYDRKIIVRDRIMFHHFSNGSCSCNDYW
ncbi:uncharacterized protein A4U43_C08F8320 [Asparagus officinalis]|nr:uncharacterized protein A4U43_C08F8320 [Asparagus officinalis]